MSAAEVHASAAGYVVGKVTGRLRGSYGGTDPLEIWSDQRSGWLPFPRDLLSPWVSGWEMDELPAILESYLLAIAACGHHPDLRPLLPYIELRHLYATVTQDEVVDAQTIGARRLDHQRAVKHLTRWITDGYRPLGGNSFSTPEPGPTDLESPAGRKQATLDFLSQHAANYRSEFKVDSSEPNPHLRAYDRRPMLAALAKEVVWALESVHSIVSSISTSSEEVPVATSGLKAM